MESALIPVLDAGDGDWPRVKFLLRVKGLGWLAGESDDPLSLAVECKSSKARGGEGSLITTNDHAYSRHWGCCRSTQQNESAPNLARSLVIGSR